MSAKTQHDGNLFIYMLTVLHMWKHGDVKFIDLRGGTKIHELDETIAFPSIPRKLPKLIILSPFDIQ